MEKPKNLYARPIELKGVIAGGKGVPGRGGQVEKYWDNCNSMNNKIFLRMQMVFGE